MKELVLYSGGVALIDDNMLEIVLLHSTTWRIDAGYAYCKSKLRKGKTTRLHQVVMNKFNGWKYNIDIDHIDRNPLNCQISNLRFCTRSQNMCNIPKKRNSSSQYKGVTWMKDNNKWRSQIQVNRKIVHGGLFLIEKDAAIRSNELYIKHYGEFAVLNII